MHRKAAVAAVTVFLGLLLGPLPAQDPKLPGRPKDLEQELLARPLAPAPAAGNRLEVLDAATEAPIAGADVFVIDNAAIAELRRPLRELQKELAGEADTYQKLLACWYGAHYRTGTDGTAQVAPVEQGLLVVLAPQRFLGAPFRRWPEDGWTVKMKEHVEFEVLVTDSSGRPAAGAPVLAGRLYGPNGDERWFQSLRELVTDGTGRARVPAELLQGYRDLTVQLAVFAEKPIRGRFEVDDQGRPTGPVRLQLPACGQVRVLLYDDREHPFAALRDVTLHDAEQSQHGQDAVRPSTMTADAALFRWVALGRQLRVDVRVDGLDGVLQHHQAGPTRAGELVICGVRMTATDPIVRLRVLGADRQPLGKTRLGLVRAAAKTFEGSELTTDEAGRLQFTVSRSWLQEAVEPKVLLLRRGPSREETQYRGAVVVPVAEDTHGIVDLGDVTFAEEPVLLGGVVVDGEGRPLPGVVVTAQLSHLLECNSTSHGGGGPIYFAHRARTDAEGRFCLRELSPKDVPVPLSLQGGKWVLAERTEASAGGELRLVALRAGRVVVRLAAPGRPDNLGLVLKTKDGEDRHSWLRDGAVEWNDLLPGTYSLCVSALGRQVEVVRDLEVKAGEDCADPRLLDLRLQDHVVFARVTVRGPDGKPRDGIEVHGVFLHKGGGSASSSQTRDGGRVEFTFPRKGGKVSIVHPDFRTVTVDDPPADCRIDLVPRARVRLRLREGVALPDSVIVVLQPGERTWWAERREPTEVEWRSGKETIVRPDRAGNLQVEILDQGRASLWKGTVAVPAGDEVELVLPIDAAAAAEITKVFDEGKR
ncbi:MAG: hypothetical protein FJ265_03485 [Planctomycetes bacterium]|nr:hypothetical protein [Planctomycetota bacterium]